MLKLDLSPFVVNKEFQKPLPPDVTDEVNRVGDAVLKEFPRREKKALARCEGRKKFVPHNKSQNRRATHRKKSSHVFYSSSSKRNQSSVREVKKREHNRSAVYNHDNRSRQGSSSSSSSSFVVSKNALESGAVWDDLLKRYPLPKKKASVPPKPARRTPKEFKPIQVEADLKGAIERAMELKDHKTLYCMMMPLNSLVGRVAINPILLSNKGLATRIQNSLSSQELISLASNHSNLLNSKLFLSLMTGAMAKDSPLLK